MSGIQPHPSVVCTMLDEGGVLLHLDTKYYYSLNRTGMAVWALLEAGHDDPAAALAARYPGVDCAAAVARFLAELRRESLVDEGTSSSPSPLPELPAGAWQAPQLDRYSVPLNQILSNPFDPSVPLAE